MQGTRNDGRHAWRKWYDRRQEARETAMSEEEFGPIERDKFDLDTARIDGTDNPESYRLDPYGDGQNEVDYRDVDPRFG